VSSARRIWPRLSTAPRSVRMCGNPPTGPCRTSVRETLARHRAALRSGWLPTGQVSSLTRASSKVLALDDAVRALVDEHDTVYVDEHAFAGIRAVARRFRSGADLTMVCTRGGEAVPDLLISQAVTRLVASSLLSRAADPSRIAILQAAIRDGSLEYEEWSLYVLAQRFAAGAMGLPFFPTRSLAGSSIASGKTTVGQATVTLNDTEWSSLVVAPLIPDIAIVHAFASDEYGRALFAPPYPDGMWGARASKKGVLVTTERIVTTEFVRQYPRFRLFPADRVVAVCDAEFGCYPYQYLATIPGLPAGYREDAPLLREYRRALADVELHRQWVDEWILGPLDELSFRQKAGIARQEELRLTAPPGQSGQAPAPLRGTPNKESTGAGLVDQPLELMDPADRIAIVTARRIVHEVQRLGTRIVLIGHGPALSAAALARFLLGDDALSVEFLIGTGILDAEPLAVNRAVMIGTAGWLAGIDDAYGVAMGGPSRSLAIISTAQLDCQGNLNSTLIRHGQAQPVALAGSGGANDATSLADSVVVQAPYRRGRFVRSVDYITCPGTYRGSVVTDFGSMEKESSSGQLQLRTTIGDWGNLTKLIAEESGWQIENFPDVRPEERLSGAEARALGALRGGQGRE
jgi:acyl CoA:acetate/3-ketoacid CoA transferase alpha subunit